MENVPPAETCQSSGENTCSNRNVSTGNVCSLSSQLAHSAPEFQTASCDKTVNDNALNEDCCIVEILFKMFLFSLCPKSQNIISNSAPSSQIH